MELMAEQAAASLLRRQTLSAKVVKNLRASWDMFFATMTARNPLVILSVYLLLLQSVTCGETPEKPKSIFWEPYRYDGNTVGLIHFDDLEMDDVEAELEDPEDEEGGGLDLALPSSDEQGEGRSAANAVMSGEKLHLIGACRIVANQGRFGGGLRFDGGDGRLMGRLPVSGTLEFWMQPEKPKGEAFTILHLFHPANRRAGPVVLRLLKDGSIELDWAGLVQRVPSYQLREELWTHVSLARQGSTVEFRLDGELIQFEKPLKSEKGGLNRYVIGNDRKAKTGFRGVLDELRVSNGVREYYPRTFGWALNDNRNAAKEGRPYFRDANDLLLHLNFNRTFIPVKAPDEVVAPDEIGEARKLLQFIDPERPRPLFAEGIEGHAVAVGNPGKDAVPLTYRGQLLAPGRGTIAFWVRPLNWNNEVTWNQFAPYGKKTIRLFEVLAGENERVAHFTLTQTPHNEAWHHPVDIHPGRWMHLCMAWENKRRTFFLDGEPWPYWEAWHWQVKEFDPKKELALRFGRDRSQCAVDDFRIYNRALAPSEVANIAALFDPRREVHPLSSMEMTFGYNGILGQVDVQLYPLTPDFAKVNDALVTVTPQNADEPIGQQKFESKDSDQIRGRVTTPPMEFGGYEVKAVARDAEGKPICEVVDTFDRKEPPWWRNKIGVSDKVMPGWTPVEMKGKTLSVVRRDIRFSDSGLPESLISAGEEILAAPITLTATAGGNAQKLRPVAGAFRAETKGEVRADFTGKSTGAGINAEVKGYIEFDGMTWFSVTLNGIENRESSIQHLSLTIPHKEDASRLLHWWSGAHGFRNPRVVHIGATPDGEGQVFSSLDRKRVQLHGKMRGSFIPYVMLAGDLRGMAWFAENDKGWTYSTESPGVEIRREGQTVSLVLNIISDALAISEPRTFEFGLHPIPVKPLQKGFRMTPSWGVLPDSFCGFNLKGTQATQFYRHPENMDWEMVAQRYRGELGSQGAAHREPQFDRGFRRTYGRDPKPHERMTAGLYHDLSGIHSFPDHTREWSGHVWRSRKYTPEMIDYCAWIWNEWVRRGFARGIYYDNCFNYPMDSGDAPVSYEREDGTTQPGFQWRQKREHMRRTRQIFHDHGLRPHLCSHTTHTYFIPYHSFFDVILDGEDFYTTAGQKRDFMDSWTPARVRFMNHEKWGLTTTWLGWFAGTGGNWKSYQTMLWQRWRTYTAALLANDIVWTVVHLGGQHEIDKKWIKESQLALDPETEFIGSWDAKPVATHAHDNLYACAWKRESWCAVALVNWSRTRIESEVRLDPKRMGFGSVAVDVIQIRDVDRTLLSYFDQDLTKLKTPDAEDIAGEELETSDKREAGDLEAGADDEESELEELGFKKKVTLKDRKANDPDGKFEWKDGLLKCPVRPHDFRLFVFQSK